MTTDLTQLRWQHVRVVENSQLLLQENVDLRRQLQDLRESYSSSDDARKQATHLLASGVRKRLRSLRDDTKQLKSLVSSDLSEISSSFSELKHQWRKAAMLQGKKNADASMLQSDIADLQRRLAELQKDYDELDIAKSASENAAEGVKLN